MFDSRHLHQTKRPKNIACISHIFRALFYALTTLLTTLGVLSEGENLMNTMASEGWEVVSVSPDAHTKLTIHLLITFSREK